MYKMQKTDFLPRFSLFCFKKIFKIYLVRVDTLFFWMYSEIA